MKGEVVRELEPLVARAGAYFVGSHPMAGGEKTGVLAARADLFKNAVCVLTPTRKSYDGAVRKLGKFWKTLGGRVLKLSPERHDELAGRASHLPHVLAVTLAGLVLDPALPEAQLQLCGGGFRDTTRIASGSPEMWRDIALSNRKNLAKSIAAFVSELQKFQRVLKRADGRALSKVFKTAKARRDGWCADSTSTE